MAEQIDRSVVTSNRVSVAAAEEFKEGERRLVEVDGEPVGVFKVFGEFVAYSGHCLHAGGPVCEGQIFPRIEVELDEMGRVLNEKSRPDKPQLVCPWHGWEYDLLTGKVVGGPDLSLRRYEVEVEDGTVYVRG